MKPTPKVRAYLAGVLVSNSAPHLATAAAGLRHLTPLAGRASAPSVNLVWGLANLAGGLTLLRSAARAEERGGGWDSRLLAFEGGCVTFAAWMLTSEWWFRINHS